MTDQTNTQNTLFCRNCPVKCQVCKSTQYHNAITTQGCNYSPPPQTPQCWSGLSRSEGPSNLIGTKSSAVQLLTRPCDSFLSAGRAGRAKPEVMRRQQRKHITTNLAIDYKTTDATKLSCIITFIYCIQHNISRQINILVNATRRYTGTNRPPKMAISWFWKWKPHQIGSDVIQIHVRPPVSASPCLSAGRDRQNSFRS
jgi:hypothetical protein